MTAIIGLRIGCAIGEGMTIIGMSVILAALLTIEGASFVAFY